MAPRRAGQGRGSLGAPAAERQRIILAPVAAHYFHHQSGRLATSLRLEPPRPPPGPIRVPARGSIVGEPVRCKLIELIHLSRSLLARGKFSLDLYADLPSLCPPPPPPTAA